MSNFHDKDRGDGSGELSSRIADLVRQDEELERSILSLTGCAPSDGHEPVSLLAARSALSDRRLRLMARWMDLLTRRLRAVESGSECLARRIQGQEGNLLTVCEMLKQLDDPYGLGEAQDERFRGSRHDRTSNEAEG
jgi:hypothetical protein